MSEEFENQEVELTELEIQKFKKFMLENVTIESEINKEYDYDNTYVNVRVNLYVCGEAVENYGGYYRV